MDIDPGLQDTEVYDQKLVSPDVKSVLENYLFRSQFNVRAEITEAVYNSKYANDIDSVICQNVLKILPAYDKNNLRYLLKGGKVLRMLCQQAVENEKKYESVQSPDHFKAFKKIVNTLLTSSKNSDWDFGFSFNDNLSETDYNSKVRSLIQFLDQNVRNVQKDFESQMTSLISNLNIEASEIIGKSYDTSKFPAEKKDELVKLASRYVFRPAKQTQNEKKDIVKYRDQNGNLVVRQSHTKIAFKNNMNYGALFQLLDTTRVEPQYTILRVFMGYDLVDKSTGNILLPNISNMEVLDFSVSQSEKKKSWFEYENVDYYNFCKVPALSYYGILLDYTQMFSKELGGKEEKRCFRLYTYIAFLRLYLSEDDYKKMLAKYKIDLGNYKDGLQSIRICNSFTNLLLEKVPGLWELVYEKSIENFFVTKITTFVKRILKTTPPEKKNIMETYRYFEEQVRDFFTKNNDTLKKTSDKFPDTLKYINGIITFFAGCYRLNSDAQYHFNMFKDALETVIKRSRDDERSDRIFELLSLYKDMCNDNKVCDCTRIPILLTGAELDFTVRALLSRFAVQILQVLPFPILYQSPFTNQQIPDSSDTYVLAGGAAFILACQRYIPKSDPIHKAIRDGFVISSDVDCYVITNDTARTKRKFMATLYPKITEQIIATRIDNPNWEFVMPDEKSPVQKQGKWNKFTMLKDDTFDSGATNVQDAIKSNQHPYDLYRIDVRMRHKNCTVEMHEHIMDYVIIKRSRLEEYKQMFVIYVEFGGQDMKITGHFMRILTKGLFNDGVISYIEYLYLQCVCSIMTGTKMNNNIYRAYYYQKMILENSTSVLTLARRICGGIFGNDCGLGAKLRIVDVLLTSADQIIKTRSSVIIQRPEQLRLEHINPYFSEKFQQDINNLCD
jgi:hypothetical protein